jgi:hypothetical protein
MDIELLLKEVLALRRGDVVHSCTTLQDHCAVCRAILRWMHRTPSDELAVGKMVETDARWRALARDLDREDPD